MGRVKLTRSVFLKLHDLVLEKFQQEYEATAWDFDKLGKYQIYGYAEYQKDKPSLPKAIEEYPAVKNYLDNYEKEYRKARPSVNGQYLYSRYIKFKANKHAPPVTLAGIYAKIYFLYLDVEDLQSFLSLAREKEVLDEEAIVIQKILVNAEIAEEEKKKYIVNYGFAYYSRKLNRIYCLDLEINFTPGLIRTSTEKLRSFEARALETKPPEGERAKKYKGTASYNKSILTINLESTDDKEDLYISLQVGDFKKLSKRKIIAGSYISRSRDLEVISGLTYVYKLKAEENAESIPNPIRKRLLSVRNQVRTRNRTLDQEKLEAILEDSGYGKKLDLISGNYFRLFVLNQSHELVEIPLEICKDYHYTMILQKTEAGTYLVKGRARLLQGGNILYFEGKKSSGRLETEKLLFSNAFANVEKYDKDRLLEGNFTWTAVQNKNVFPGRFMMVWSEKKIEPNTYRNPLRKEIRSKKGSFDFGNIKSYFESLPDKYCRQAFKSLLFNRRLLLDPLYLEEYDKKWAEIF